MKPEEVTRPVLFQLTYFYNRLIGGGGMARDWIESPRRSDHLGFMLKKVHDESFSDGYRVGSRWTMHTKFVPRMDLDGSFSVEANVNMDRNDHDYAEATRAADAFKKVAGAFLRYRDEEWFSSGVLADDYERLNRLLQQGYGAVKTGRLKDARMKYDTAFVHVANMLELSPDELKTTQRLAIPLFLLDSHALEAIVGTEVARLRSPKHLPEMEKDFGSGRNPYWREERAVIDIFSGVVDGGLRPYDGDGGVVQRLRQLPRAKRGIVTARSLYGLRTQNGSVTNAYRENVELEFTRR